MTIASNVIAILNLATTIRANQTQVIIPDLGKLSSQVAALQTAIDAIKLELTPPATGNFNPPVALVKQATMEVSVSVIQLEVGQTAVGKLTFDEINPPADGAVISDNPSVCPISLAADMVTWTLGPALAVGSGNANYSGTSTAPDTGPAVVPAMTFTVVAVPVAEHGDFDPTHAVITGP
jgi:hypothetical protein